MSGGMIIIDTSGLADIVMTTNGDMIYYNAGRQRLAKGSDGQQLQLAGGFPSWVTSAGGSVATDELVNDYSTTLADYDESMTTATASNNDSSAYTLDQLNDSSTNSMDGSYGTHGYALKIEAGSSLVGVDVTSIKMKLMKQNSWSGSATVGVGSTCGSTSTHVFGSRAGSSLSTSSWTLCTFNTGSHTMAVDDYIAITGNSLNDYYECKVAGDSGSPIANTPMYANRQSGGCQTGGSTFYLEVEGTANHVPTNAIDGSTTSFWQSTSGANNWLQIDLGSNQDVTAMTIYLDTTVTTETQFLLQSSSDALSWNDLRTINVSDLSAAVYNYIRFNPQNARYFRIYGNSGSSHIMKINEVALQPLTINLHGHLGIDPTNATLALNGE